MLATAAKGIAEIITVPGYINVDFADVETVMRKSGLAIMGTGVAGGENRAADAIANALNSPLLNNNDIRGARNVLLNITSGSIEVTMDEIGEISDYVQNKAGFDADLIWGNGTDESLGEKLSVTVIATGFKSGIIPELNKQPVAEGVKMPLFEPQASSIPSNHTIQKKDQLTPGQKFIEFDIETKNEKDDIDFEDLYPVTTRERKIHNHTSGNCEEMTEEDIDNLESVPAYKRRQLRMNDPQYKKQKSNYSVTSENRISDKNAYLHRQVD